MRQGEWSEEQIIGILKQVEGDFRAALENPALPERHNACEILRDAGLLEANPVEQNASTPHSFDDNTTTP